MPGAVLGVPLVSSRRLLPPRRRLPSVVPSPLPVPARLGARRASSPLGRPWANDAFGGGSGFPLVEPRAGASCEGRVEMCGVFPLKWRGARCRKDGDIGKLRSWLFRVCFITLAAFSASCGDKHVNFFSVTLYAK